MNGYSDDVVKAELVGFDGVEEGVPPLGEDDAPCSVRVVAPCDLPANFKLMVNGNNNDRSAFEVIVPQPGVSRGETFMAEKWQPNPIEGQFGDGLCNCGAEGFFCIVATFCPIMAYGAIMEKLGLTAFASRSFPSRPPQKTFKIVSILWAVFVTNYFLVNVSLINHASVGDDSTPLWLPIVMPIIYLLGLYFIVIQVRTLMAFRHKYNIPGNCFQDCCVSYWCGCCSVLRMYRHMKRSGDRPVNFTNINGIEAEIV